MSSKVKSKGRKRSPSPSVSSEASSSSSSSSEASSSRFPMQVTNMEDTSSTDSRSDEAGEEEEVSDEIDSISSSSPPQPQIDLTKAKTKLHHVAKTLRATAKKTKTFEVQKQVKKLKGLQKKPSLAEQATLAEQELDALKCIDITLLAGRALVTKMVKAKILPRPAELQGGVEEGEFVYLEMVKEEELLGEAVLSDPVVTDGDRALERAKAKITSSKVLADEVGRFVDKLRRLVGLEAIGGRKEELEMKEEEKEEEERKWSGSEEEEERKWSGSEEEEDDSDDETRRRLPLVEGYDEEEKEDVGEEELMRIGKEKMKALGDLSQWDDMIGSDSAAESGFESDNEEGPTQRRTSKSKHQSEDSDASESEDDSSSDSEDDSDSDSDASSASSSSSISDRPRKRKSKTSTSDRSSKKSKSSSANSTLLPSLSTGFLAGRSDDEWSDAEADLADRDLSELKSGSKKERRNRMGQRARKALYEKKYGKNANHIKMREKQKAVKRERSSTRASGVRGGGGDGNGRQRPPAFQAPAKRDGGWGGPVAPLPKQAKRPFVPRAEPISAPPASAGATQSGVKVNRGAKAGGENKTQEMHPSWIAKQKQKELMTQVKPQGKKVVFD
ncbi:hypothetical protein NDA11_001006 [Ustilago hordei]|uniref:Bud22 domain-containing protein n=1 Tax=Ustilago hordei TaxID=120017 RepID=I2G2M2_USTHO|nr:uncharacterized protein UHO2_02710 [Ustilago hordei]KAJ1040391.1 hypothetical protein NDA10_007796 [Ustilago hordei]KAJ1585525.1 hypothetical protein NDA15_007064 [Ustilago hordei]KAJ1588021.1 hypothetical protein NDA12_003038 [Ustilago hordei]KAJ1592714.1 hypothetical protein NDA11_001006 [Ustilago hordei]CCF53415.1 uncharacterized protein UHOR_02546 [Ustilago hordei]